MGRKRKYQLNENYFELIDSEDKAYWLGFIAADGCVYGNELKIELAGKDVDHLYKFRKAIESTHPVKEFIRDDKWGKYKKCWIRLKSKKLIKDLENLEIKSRKTKNLQWIQVNDNLMKHFIRGYVDGDGSFYSAIRNNRKSKSCSFKVTSTQDVCNGIKNILMKECSLSDIKLEKHSSYTYTLRWGGRLQAFKIGKYLYEDANIFMNRKKDKALSFFEVQYVS